MLIPGQPFIGPPGCSLAYALFDAADLQKRKQPQFLSFVGNTSPIGHLLEMISGLHK